MSNDENEQTTNFEQLCEELAKTLEDWSRGEEQ